MYKGVMVSVVIPCFNESLRVPRVIKSVLKAKLVDEVIVIDDGSVDGSSSEISKFNKQIKLISHKTNKGKASAVLSGVKASKSEVIFTLDADLIGLKPYHVDGDIKEFVDRDLDMLIMPVHSPAASLYHYVYRKWEELTGSNIVASGQRLFKRKLFLAIMKGRAGDLGYGLELYLNKVAKKNEWKTDVIIWAKDIDSLSHTSKVEKHGVVEGLKKEVEMVFSNIFKEANILDYLSDYNLLVRKARKKQTR